MCHWIEDFRDIKFYRLDIGEYAGTADEYGIKVLPTIILFDNGEEVVRFQGDIQFKLCPEETPKKLQKAIDGILVGRF
jgi:thioredoxin-like negative regulator of GroEL